jgi:hypothetical protein
MPRYTPRYRAVRGRHARHAFPWTRPSARVVRLAVVLLAVVLLASVTMLTRPPTAHGSAAANGARHIVGPDTLPEVARWQDETQQTAFSIRLRAPAAASVNTSTSKAGFAENLGNQYSFTLPSGDQIVGAVFLTKQPNGDFTGSRCHVARLLSGKPQQVAATLDTYFDADALVAFARIRYIVANTIDGANGLAFLCKQANTTLTMQSGCDPSGACLDPVATASQTPPQYENLLIAANKSPSPEAWRKIFESSSSVIRGQYSNDQFAAAMAHAIEKVGKITAIAPVAEMVAVQTSATGQTYFIAHSDVTFSLKGQSSTRRIASYYLLEGGQWRFWFSVPADRH